MKPFCSWILLLLISLQWIGGHLCFKVMHSVIVETPMNAEEEAVADAMKAETGVKGHIHILREDPLDLAKRMGYSNVFIFSKEIGGDTVYFTVEPAPLEKVTYGYAAGHTNNQPDKAHRTALLKRLFSGFVLNGDIIPPPGNQPASPEANFAVTSLSDLFNPSIPLPPPKQV